MVVDGAARAKCPNAPIDLEVPADPYQVIDSDPAAWAWNDEAGGRGMVTLIVIAG